MKLPSWMRWLFLAFIGYILYMGNFVGRPVATPPIASDAKHTEIATKPAAVETTKAYPVLQQVTSRNLWARAINPNAKTIPQITDITQGSGMELGCGSTATITLRGTRANGANFDAAHDEKTPLTFRVGAAPYPVLNAAIIGMTKGGVRSIHAPEADVFANKKTTNLANVQLYITLQNHHEPAPVNPEKALPLTIAVLLEGDTQGVPVLCGEKARMHIQHVGVNGALSTVHKGNVTLGVGELPAALHRAMHGMLVGEQRLVLGAHAPNAPHLISRID